MFDRYKECRKCGGEVIRNNAKITAKKLRRQYFYSQFYKCKGCKTIYYYLKDIVYPQVAKSNLK